MRQKNKIAVIAMAVLLILTIGSIIGSIAYLTRGFRSILNPKDWLYVEELAYKIEQKSSSEVTLKLIAPTGYFFFSPANVDTDETVTDSVDVGALVTVAAEDSKTTTVWDEIYATATTWTFTSAVSQTEVGLMTAVSIMSVDSRYVTKHYAFKVIIRDGVIDLAPRTVPL